jgi:hypothetical protein
MSIAVAASSIGPIIRPTGRAPDTTMRICSRGLVTAISAALPVGKALLTRVGTAIAVDAAVQIVVGQADRQVRVERPATGRREAARLRAREVGDPVGRQRGRRTVEHQEPVMSDRPPACATAEEGRGSPGEDTEPPHSTAVAVSAVVEGVAAEASGAEVAVAGVARTSG